MKDKDKRRLRRKYRIRKSISGVKEKPRMTVYRSNKYIVVQLIDDVEKKTLAFASDLKIKKGTKSERATLVGEEIAKLASKKKIKQVVFDRNGYKFHGRIKALADSAKKNGLVF